MKPGIEKRLTDSIETVVELTGGLMTVEIPEQGTMNFSQNFACPDCGINLSEIEPRLFSFNNPSGACPECMGLCMQMKFDPELIVPNPKLSIIDGAINAPGYGTAGHADSMTRVLFDALSEKYGFSLSEPFENLPEK